VGLPNGGLPYFLLFSGDGGTLVSIGSSGTSGASVVVRDAHTLRPKRVIRLRLEVAGAALLRRSQALVVVGTAGSGVVVDTDSGGVRRIMRAASSRVPAVAVSADGESIATARSGGTVDLWDTAGHRNGSISTGIEPAAAAFSPHGALLVVVATDGTAAIWSARTHVRLRTLQLGASAGLRFSPDGRTLAVATSRGTIVLWDVASGTRLGSLAADPGGYPVDFAFAPNGERLLSTGADGVAFIWNLDDHAWDRIACRVAGRTFTPPERHQFLGTYAKSTRVCERRG
jgi:WD40 repeat protein